jgi:hypothetical protein
MTDVKPTPPQAKHEDPKPDHKVAPAFGQDDADKLYEPRRVQHRKALSGSQLVETGEGSPVFKPGETGRVVDDEGYELSVAERLALLEGDHPSYGNRV